MIVAVLLPLERLATLGEELHLARDELVQRLTVQAAEVAIFDHPSLAEAGRPEERPVPLGPHTSRKAIRYVRTQLRVVRGQQGERVLSLHDETLFGGAGSRLEKPRMGGAFP